MLGSATRLEETEDVEIEIEVGDDDEVVAEDVANS